MPTSKKESTFDKEVETEPKPTKVNKAKKALYNRSVIISSILVLFLIIALGAGAYYYTQYTKAQELLKNPITGEQLESQKLIDKVGKLIQLPLGEQPTLATVSDITKLKNQQFFKNAQNGDKVLIYQKAKKAILYRPATNKIIEIGPINLGNQEVTQSASPSAVPTTQPIKVVLLNGTKTPGLATTTEKQLILQMPNVTVVSKGNAKLETVKTLVIDLTGKSSSAASQVATVLKGEVGKLPVGEVKPTDADFLVILGGR